LLYYSMNVIWPRQSQTMFVSADQVILRGAYATFFSIGSFSKFFNGRLIRVLC
jgi:hypothetical protein